MNERAWSIWSLLETRWNVGGFGGLIGWAGYTEATELLLHGYGVRGQDLLAEVERLKMFENAQMEIEAARRKRQKEEEERKKKRPNLNPEAEHTEGDLSDFEDANKE